MQEAIFTVGHSSRTLDEFLGVVRHADIELIADVRAFPGSRRQPHFGSEALEASLAEVGIGYRHLRDLGGRRRLPKDADTSSADAWRNDSFRAYAMYAQTSEYEAALAELLQLAASSRVAIMCSEAVPWRCHRWLVSDTLVASGHRVLHVIDERSLRTHEISPFAQVHDGKVTWPGPPSSQSLHLGPPVAT